MRTLALSLVVAVATLGWSVCPAGAQPSAAGPSEHHKVLQRMVGEWTTVSQIVPGTGQPPMTCRGTASIRSLGGLWIVSEMKSTMGDTPIHGIQTIGYDPQAKQYVGTWVDNMMPHLWHYTGRVEEDGARLVLEAEGPSYVDPAATATYRDAYQFESDGTITATSSVQGPDGEWEVMVTGTLTRAKPAVK